MDVLKEPKLKLIIIILLLISAPVSAEWINYLTDSNGNEYFYNNTQINRTSDSMIVWERVRHKVPLLEVIGSSESHMHIGCERKQFQQFKISFYFDQNWKNQHGKTGNDKKKREFVPSSSMEYLAKLLCR
ncbi:MAG: hypothetical protein CMK56_06210 [Proteobacteria bacterium]|nr:hypothetical protein [Pseudomonadota bacterium]|tara:strand:+ start:334 stop:723 length:390 start_codon:yes stop_codon:yes gene_type:complete